MPRLKLCGQPISYQTKMAQYSVHTKKHNQRNIDCLGLQGSQNIREGNGSLRTLRLNFKECSIGDFLELMVVSIKIKRQAREENAHHNRCSFDLFMIQKTNLLNPKKRKG